MTQLRPGSHLSNVACFECKLTHGNHVRTCSQSGLTPKMIKELESACKLCGRLCGEHVKLCDNRPVGVWCCYECHWWNGAHSDDCKSRPDRSPLEVAKALGFNVEGLK